MQRVALDTNILTQILRGNVESIEKQLDNINIYYIPWVVYAELLAGIKSGSNPEKYMPALESFMKEFDVETSTAIAWQVTSVYAEIYTYLKKNGTPVSPNDLWVAAECVANGLPLFTLDSDFKKIPQVLLFH